MIRFILWILFTLMVAVVSCVVLTAAEPPAKVKAALALAQAEADCKDGDPFTLQPAEPIKKPKVEKEIDSTDYSSCRAESIRTGKHLVVWHSYRCKSSEVQLPDAIHCFVKEGDLVGVKGAVVLVGVPRDGDVFESGRIPASELCAMTLKQACAGTYQPGRISGSQVRASGG